MWYIGWCGVARCGGKRMWEEAGFGCVNSGEQDCCCLVSIGSSRSSTEIEEGWWNLPQPLCMGLNHRRPPLVHLVPTSPYTSLALFLPLYHLYHSTSNSVCFWLCISISKSHPQDVCLLGYLKENSPLSPWFLLSMLSYSQTQLLHQFLLILIIRNQIA